MSDLNKSQENTLPYSTEAWEQDWMMANDGAYAEQRRRGLEVLHRIETNLPLSPREAAIAQRVNNNPAWESYKEAGFDEPTMARIMADNMGSFLANPDGHAADLAAIAQLSDERPMEALE